MVEKVRIHKFETYIWRSVTFDGPLTSGLPVFSGPLASESAQSAKGLQARAKGLASSDSIAT